MTHPTLRQMIDGWTAVVWDALHPRFAEALEPCVIEAHATGIPVRPRSAWRSNTAQRQLYEHFLSMKGDFDTGRSPVRPLPAAPPGASAHNYSVCPTDPAHLIGGKERCPFCGSPPTAASLALDIGLLDAKGEFVPSGGALALPMRPAIWQRWAAHLQGFPLLRDGGLFHPRPDAVHVEHAAWDYAQRAFRP